MKRIHGNISQRRLKGRDLYRNRAELLRSRLHLLSGKDRLLMTMYLENTNSFRQMARLAGISEANIARRIHKLTERLSGGEYIAALRCRSRFTGTEMLIARDYFLRGLSIRRITAGRRCSFHRVRETLKKVRRLVEEAGTDQVRADAKKNQPYGRVPILQGTRNGGLLKGK